MEPVSEVAEHGLEIEEWPTGSDEEVDEEPSLRPRPRQDKKPPFIFLAPVTWSVTSGRDQCCIRGTPLGEQRRDKVGRFLGSRKKGSHDGCGRLEEKLEGLRRWPSVQVATFRAT